MHDKDFLKLDYNQLDKWIFLGMTQPWENWLEPTRSKMVESLSPDIGPQYITPTVTYQQAK